MKQIFRFKNQGTADSFIWTPVHIGVEGNEVTDKNAKSASKLKNIGIDIKISKAEAKTIIRKALIEAWQKPVGYGGERTISV